MIKKILAVMALTLGMLIPVAVITAPNASAAVQCNNKSAYKTIYPETHASKFNVTMSVNYTHCVDTNGYDWVTPLSYKGDVQEITWWGSCNYPNLGSFDAFSFNPGAWYGYNPPTFQFNCEDDGHMYKTTYLVNTGKIYSYQDRCFSTDFDIILNNDLDEDYNIGEICMG